jgi:PKD repeat protein
MTLQPPENTADPRPTPGATPDAPPATGATLPPGDAAPWYDQPTGPLPPQYQTGPVNLPPGGIGAAPPGGIPPSGESPAGPAGPPRALWLALAAVLAVVAGTTLVVLARTGGWAGSVPAATATITAAVSPTANAPTDTPTAVLPTSTVTLPTAAPTVGPPVAVIEAPPVALVGQAVPFSGAGSASGTTIVDYAWAFGDGGRSRGSEVEHAFGAAGKYQVQLTVTDSAGRQGRATTSVQIQANPQRPPAAVLVGPPSGMVGQSLAFDASSSQAGTAAITRYAWQFGDGATSQGMTVAHTFTRPGTYQVVLVVTDASGLTDDASLQVVVAAPAPPKAVIKAPDKARVGDTLTFDGGASTSGSPIVAYQWRFGDGGGTDAVVAKYTYGKADTYQVTLTVVDGTGARDTATHTLLIEGPTGGGGPTAVIAGPDRSTVGRAVTYTGTGSRAGSSPIATYDWVVGGTGGRGAGSGPTFSYTFPAPGSYVVTLIVTDTAGLADSASLNVTVGRGP